MFVLLIRRKTIHVSQCTLPLISRFELCPLSRVVSSRLLAVEIRTINKVFFFRYETPTIFSLRDHTLTVFNSRFPSPLHSLIQSSSFLILLDVSERSSFRFTITRANFPFSLYHLFPTRLHNSIHHHNLE